MMECNTTGIEPDLALVKYKKLLGGGHIKIVNNTVPQALMKLGYTPEQSSEIVSYIDKNGKIEGARYVKRSEEHTSELQSLTNLVCRLLLEKKKIQLQSTEQREQDGTGSTEERE